jgi:[NiFe] hydrogenase small subunit
MHETLDERLKQKGLNRRDFLKVCGLVTATLGMPMSMMTKVAEALENQRPSVVWLHFAECTGCSEALLRSTYPDLGQILFDIVSVDYHETVMAAAGTQVEELLADTVAEHKGKYICVVEGAVPTREGYGVIAGKPMAEIAKHVCVEGSPLAVIAIGQCAGYGGVQAAAPNPSQAKTVSQLFDIQTINIAGCPPNPINLLGAITHYLLLGKLPELDKHGRPLFAYGQTIHDQCPRRGHYEDGNFVQAFDDDGAREGWCLFEVGCKGPETYNNCPLVKFNDGTSWPIQAGHPCIGCSEPNFWDQLSPFYKSI